MSLTLNMVGGGGGGISGNTAVLEVIAPTGSTVSITDGVTTKTQTAADGHPVSDRQAVEAYIFPVGSDELGTWTITATRGTETNTTTVTISAIMDYVVYIGYHVPIDQYQEVEYLENTGSSYINLNITPSTDFKINLTAAQTATGDGLFAMQGSAVERRLEFYVESDNKVLIGGRGDASGSWTQAKTTGTVNLNQFYDFEYVRNSNTHTLQVIGETKTISVNTGALTGAFLYRYYSSSTYYCKARVKYAKIYNGGTLVRELYPCYRLYDSVAGLWDKVSQTFLTNAGSGTFTVGSDV